MTEKLSSEAKGAIEQLLDRILPRAGSYRGYTVESAMCELEAKLSPKYPPDGAICEVWSNVDSDRWPAISDGEKLVDLFPGSVTGYIDSWDFSEVHYRRIVTAEEALKALRAAYFGATYPDGDRDNERAWAISVIQRLIDDAERG